MTAMLTPSSLRDLQCVQRLPYSCICSEQFHTRTAQQRAHLPLCTASNACSQVLWNSPAFRQQPQLRASIGIFFGFNRSRVRHFFVGQPFPSYLKDITLAMRLVLSLRRVQTTLPIRLHVSGERHVRYENRFLEQGVQVVSAPTFQLPRWANPWHAASFAKLAALAVSDSDRVIVLDVDTVVLRNIDHLSGAPAPSLVFVSNTCGDKCCWEINSGVMVLSPGQEDYARLMARLTNSTKTRHAIGDGGDQSLWRLYFDRVHELPAAYNAEKRNNISHWGSVFVLHDLWGARWAKWWLQLVSEREGGLVNTYNDLTVSATRLMSHGLKPTGTPVNKTRVVCYQKHVMHVCAEDPYWRPPP